MMDQDMQFFVTARDKREREGKTEYVLTLKNGKGDRLIFKRQTSAIFEGFPMHQAVSVKITNVQKTLEELKKE